MRLRDLATRFWQIDEDGHTYHSVPTAEGAHGMFLICPCLAGHGLTIWFSNPIGVVPADGGHYPAGRWSRKGATLEDLSLGQPISLRCWHGWIRDGEITGFGR